LLSISTASKGDRPSRAFFLVEGLNWSHIYQGVGIVEDGKLRLKYSGVTLTTGGLCSNRSEFTRPR